MPNNLDLLFHVEDYLKVLWKASAPSRRRPAHPRPKGRLQSERPAAAPQCRRYKECAVAAWENFFGLNGLGPNTARRVLRAYATFASFRWVCDWCPRFVRNLRAEDASEQDPRAAEA